MLQLQLQLQHATPPPTSTYTYHLCTYLCSCTSRSTRYKTIHYTSLYIHVPSLTPSSLLLLAPSNSNSNSKSLASGRYFHSVK